MATDRTRLLEALAAARRRAGCDDAAAQEAVAARLAQPPDHPMPARGRLDDAGAPLDREGMVAVFRRMAEESLASVSRVADRHGVPQAVAGFLLSENLPAAVTLAPEPWICDIPWKLQAPLSVRIAETGLDWSREGPLTVVTGAVAGVAETGSLVLASGEGRALSLPLLAESHVVVLPAARIVATYEEVWARRWLADDETGRAAVFITGPSRSADIEKQLQIGAHGPRRVHIVIVDD